MSDPIFRTYGLQLEHTIGQFITASEHNAGYGPADLTEEEFRWLTEHKRTLDEEVAAAAREAFGPDIDGEHTLAARRAIFEAAGYPLDER